MPEKRVIYLIAVLLAGLASGCVSNRKFNALQQSALTTEQSLREELKQTLVESSRYKEQYENTRDELIKSNSSFNQIVAENILLEKKINDLNAKLGSVSSEAESIRETLYQELSEQNEILAQKDAQLSEIAEIYQTDQTQLETILSQLLDQFKSAKDSELEIKQEASQVKVILYASYLFGSNGKITAGAGKVLQQLGKTLQQYPTLPVTVTGHTDPDAANSQHNNQDNLDISVIRAASIARVLIQDAGMPSNQIEVVGVGAAQPRVSNETPAGRALNNRVEVIIRVNWPMLLRKISNINLE
ncbi:MAG: OmpA family protein [Lewinellaceae bacterium]|nr:OmpA family protein [Lewinellaceae bacterium]HPQ97990.1 OmpA family protein [Saprospiraceae bacterium]HQU54049.1 OmpA family protein [Saprospiraceae bacterium]